MNSNVRLLIKLKKQLEEKHRREEMLIAYSAPDWYKAAQGGYRDADQTKREDECGVVKNLSIQWVSEKQRYYLTYEATTYTGGKWSEGMCIPNTPSWERVSFIIAVRNAERLNLLLRKFPSGLIENTLALMLKQ